MNVPVKRGKGASPYAIRVRNLTKVFRLYDSPLDLLLERLIGRKRHVEHIALDRISFDIRHGETVGIIGRNGAGKSTLLKIIAGVLDYDEGTVEVDGRVSALLELGSGFNPEYTGRENIIFGGMCLGMSRAEILKKMDSIIAFAELEEYIDQPLKTYSSGMHSRLAFATAIAVDAEVLIVDEALAVGDMFFQAKCMAHMRKMQEQGVTILFVSHSADSVRQMCDRGILLDKGNVLLDSDAVHVTERYFNMELKDHIVSRQETGGENISADRIDTPDEGEDDKLAMTDLLKGRERFEKHAAFERVQSGEACFVNVQMLDAEGEVRENFDYGEEVVLRMVFEVREAIDGAMFFYAIRTATGVNAVWADTRPLVPGGWKLEPGKRYVLDWRFQLNLQHGNYYVKCGVSIPSESTDVNDWRFVDMIPSACAFSVAPRRGGMLGGTVVWDNQAILSCVDSL